MSDIQQQSIDLVKSFYAAKERHDLKATVELFADDVIYTFPLSASGDAWPWFVYTGKQATSEYQRGVLQRFSQIRMVDPQFTVNPDGSIVFVEAHGDYIEAESNRPYNNVYVFKFVVRGGKFVHVYEYANPVTYAKLAGLPIGQPVTPDPK